MCQTRYVGIMFTLRSLVYKHKIPTKPCHMKFEGEQTAQLYYCHELESELCATIPGMPVLETGVRAISPCIVLG